MATIHPRRIRVLHVTSGLGLGGTEKAMQLLVCHLDRDRFLPAVCSREDGPRRAALEAAGIPLFTGMDLFGVLQRFRPHVVHLHRPGWPDRGSLRPVLLHRGSAESPRIVETNVFGRFDSTPEARCIDRHLFVSRFCLERYLRMNRIVYDPARHGVLYNPVDTQFYAERCPGPVQAPVAGRVSRADRGKWSPLAWEFLPHVLREAPDFCYRIVGCVDEAMEAFARQGATQSVRCVPPVGDEAGMAGFLGSLALLAHANDTGESFGMVIAEAMAAGLPVVTHPCPGEKDNAQLELVEHGVTGLVAPDHQDAQAYAQAVLWLLRHPREAREMGERGRAKAAREYDVRVLAARLAEVYLELLEGCAS